MTDLEKFKAITRAVSGVAVDPASIAKALAAVREAMAEDEPQARKESRSRNRMFSGGLDRGEDSGA